MLNHYKDVNAFYDIRCLMEIRNKYLSLVHDDMNKEYDMFKLSKYIIAYAYYNDMPIYEVENMFNYLFNNYNEILDWCIMNNGVAHSSTPTISNNGSVKIVKIYDRIKKNFYLHVLNYLVNKTSDKQLIK